MADESERILAAFRRRLVAELQHRDDQIRRLAWRRAGAERLFRDERVFANELRRKNAALERKVAKLEAAAKIAPAATTAEKPAAVVAEVESRLSVIEANQDRREREMQERRAILQARNEARKAKADLVDAVDAEREVCADIAVALGHHETARRIRARMRKDDEMKGDDGKVIVVDFGGTE